MGVVAWLAIASFAPGARAQEAAPQAQPQRLVPMQQRTIHVQPAPQVGQAISDGPRSQLWSKAKDTALEIGGHLLRHVIVRACEHL